MNVEDLKPGDIVRFVLEPGCPGEFKVHGIAPIVNRHYRTGWFMGIDESPVPGHRYLVGFKEDGHTWHSWFSAEELAEPDPVHGPEKSPETGA